jgi:hypothetical protein
MAAREASYRGDFPSFSGDGVARTPGYLPRSGSALGGGSSSFLGSPALSASSRRILPPIDGAATPTAGRGPQPRRSLRSSSRPRLMAGAADADYSRRHDSLGSESPFVGLPSVSPIAPGPRALLPEPSPLSPALGSASTDESPSQLHTVTVFGFPPDKASAIVRKFRQFGEVLRREDGGPNWVHLSYTSPVDARMALNQNGRIVEGVMVGVLPRAADGEQPGGLEQRSFDGRSSSELSLRRARPALRDVELAPKKGTSWCQKIMEFVFAW